MLGLSIGNGIRLSVSKSLNAINDQKHYSFGESLPSEPSTTVESRRCYFHENVLSNATITVPAGSEYSLDGGAFTSVAGTRGTAKYMQCRGLSNADYSQLQTRRVVVAGVNFDFMIMTMADPIQTILAQDGEGILLQDGEQLIY